MKILLLGCVIALAVATSGQTVSTLPLTGLNGPNGFAVDKNGVLFIANEPGKKVIKVLNDSIAETVLLSDSPDGLTFDDNENLYISNFYSGVILKKSHQSVDTIATGLDKPADIKWDGKGSLFVSEYEKGNIKKINKAGEITLFATGLKFPFGLAFDNEGNLFVAENSSGVVNRIDSKGRIAFFTQVPGPLSYLAYSKKTGKLYTACFTRHTIYVITKDGKTTALSGNGIAGDKDGSLQEAQFNGPNSVEISQEGTLYISEFGLNRIRKIIKLEN